MEKRYNDRRSPNNNNKHYFRRQKSCPFSEKGAPPIDYKDVRTLQKFISEREENDTFKNYCSFNKKTERTGGCNKTS